MWAQYAENHHGVCLCFDGQRLIDAASRQFEETRKGVTLIKRRVTYAPEGEYPALILPPQFAQDPQAYIEVFFFESGSATLGVVTNVNQPNFNGLTAYAYCRKVDFAEWYDILRNEKPLKCTFAYAGPENDPNQPTRELWWIQLYTGEQEPPGEGPEDVQSKLLSVETLDMLRGDTPDER